MPYTNNSDATLVAYEPSVWPTIMPHANNDKDTLPMSYVCGLQQH